MENNNVIEGTVVPANQINLAGVMRIPAVRQVMLLLGVAGAIAAGFAIVLWSRTPAYTQLYSALEGPDAAEVADALRGTDIEFKIDPSNGSILVRETQLHDARMQLSSQGLPQGAAGMRMLDDQNSFGVSQFMESARYQHALEAELARTISSLGVVREARVHLALPKQSTFIRDQKSASASVLLRLSNGMALEADKAAAIVNLVASSVANLSAKNVTLIDQFGRLLSSGDGQTLEAQATTQFNYARRLEETYKARIEQLLTPIVGAGRIRAQVDADVNFTQTEEAREIFDPASPVIRSEQVSEENRPAGTAVAAGVPGALSNQPPETGAAIGNVAAAESSEQSEARATSRSSVRNFEMDRTVSHVQQQSGTINKLSVAVLIDDSPVDGEEGQAPMTDADVERYTALVREAVGFNEARGDTVVVVNTPFRSVEPIEEAEPPAFWEKPALMDAIKQVLGVGLALALGFGVIRPMLRGVLSSSPTVSGELAGGAAGIVAAGGGMQLAGGAAALPPPKY